MIELYVDGACSPNPGLGGWAAFFNYNNKEYSVYGYEENTTNQQMELISAIQGLNLINNLNLNDDITVYSDSQYLVNTMNLGWKKNANIDLWRALALELSFLSQRVDFVWVKGHSDNPINNYVDKMAVNARVKKVYQLPNFYVESDKEIPLMDVKTPVYDYKDKYNQLKEFLYSLDTKLQSMGCDNSDVVKIHNLVEKLKDE